MKKILETRERLMRIHLVLMDKARGLAAAGFVLRLLKFKSATMIFFYKVPRGVAKAAEL